MFGCFVEESHLHERALRIVYNDNQLPFENLLRKDRSVAIHHRNIRSFAMEIYETYENLDLYVREADLNVPVVVKECVHTPIFQNNTQRLRFFEKLHLSVPTDLIAFCSGGSHTSIFALVQVKKGRNINETLSEGGRIIQKLRPVLRECHTRAQKSDFKNRIKSIASIQPALLEMICQQPVLDSTTASHPDTAQRIGAMFPDAEGLVADLRYLNPGRSGNKYDVFFTHMEALIEDSLVAADDRRMVLTHVSVGAYQRFD